MYIGYICKYFNREPFSCLKKHKIISFSYISTVGYSIRVGWARKSKYHNILLLPFCTDKDISFAMYIGTIKAKLKPCIDVSTKSEEQSAGYIQTDPVTD